MEPSYAPSLDDAALLERYAGAADASAFAELVRRYAGMVYATARRVTGDPNAAEDVSQDCFLRLARASNAIQGSLPAWLHRTSLNRSLELVRSDRARKRREAESAAARDTDAAAVNEREESARLIAHVDEAMGQLPDELRVILTEHFLCGRTQQEIGQMLGVDQSTVSRRVDRALDGLRAKLRGAGLAVAALPAVMTSGAVRAGSGTAPPALHAALTKIGLAGVRDVGGGGISGGGEALTPPPPAAGPFSVTGATAFKVTMAGAAVVMVAVVPFWLNGRATPPAPPAAAGAAPTTSPAALARADDDDDDDEDEDDDEADGKDGKLELFDRD